MSPRFLFVLCPLIFVLSYAVAQDTQDNSLSPAKAYYPPEKAFSSKQRKLDAAKTTVDLQREYHERVAAVMKARKKAARVMQRPQYSDPSYFGHKRKPKKRSPEKMRFCSECGIRH
jgi:hypothetical protein